MGLDGVELILATEKEFGIRIADDDAVDLLTPRQLAAHVSQLLATGSGSAPAAVWTSDEVLHRVMQLTAIQLGLDLSRIQPDSRFVEDLGLD